MSEARLGTLSKDQLDEIYERVTNSASEGNEKAVRKGLQPLLDAQRNQTDAALCLVYIVDKGDLPREYALELLELVYEAHSRDAAVMAPLGGALERARDIDMLNDGPPEHPLFVNALQTLIELVEKAKGTNDELHLLKGLSVAARMMARQHDEIAEDSLRRVVELDPNNSSSHYNLGLFYKTRGRFVDGMTANQIAARLRDQPNEAVQWNLGICASGGRRGAEPYFIPCPLPYPSPTGEG